MKIEDSDTETPISVTEERERDINKSLSKNA